MKNKKVLIITIVVSILLLAVGGFAVYKKVVKNEGLFENSTKVFSEIYENTKNLKSYDMDVTSNLNDLSKQGMNLQVDSNNKITKTTTKNVVNSVEQSVEVYQQYSDKEITTYTYGAFGENWLKQTIELTEDNAKLSDNEYLTALENFDNIKKLKSDKKGYNKYQIVVDASKIAGITNSETTIDESAKITVTIYTDKKYIKTISYKSDNDSFNFDMEITYNKTNIELTIPEDVISNAKTIEEIDLSNVLDLENAEEVLKSSGIDGVDYQSIIAEAQQKAEQAQQAAIDTYQQQAQEIQQNIQSSVTSDQIQEQAQQQIQQTQDYINSIMNQ